MTSAVPAQAPVAAPCPGGRLEYLDWLRGLAVVIMIEAHTLDSWTGLPDRTSLAYGIAMMVGGMGAPLFLFLAGVSVSLAAASRARRLGAAGAARSVRARGWQVLGLAFLFRLYSWALSPGATLRGLLKVDILNVMGPSIVFAAWLWQLGRTTAGRAASLAIATVALAMVTPIVRATPWLDVLPDPLETYLRPGRGLSTFTLLPWAAFVTAGAVCGVAIQSGARDGGRRAALGCAFAGLSLWAAGYGLSFRPTIYSPSTSYFWTTSPTFLCLRVGLLSLGVAIAWAWSRRRWARLGWSPLEVLGGSSLFVYWVHVELVYGVVATPLKRALTLPQAVLAFALFTGMMLLLTLAKLRVMAMRREGRGVWSGKRLTY